MTWQRTNKAQNQGLGRKKGAKALLQKHEKRSHSYDPCNTLWTFSHLLGACQKGEPNNVIVQACRSLSSWSATSKEKTMTT